MNLPIQSRLLSPLFALTILLAGPGIAADCGGELDQLSRDPRGRPLTEAQKHSLAAFVDRAVRLCFYRQEPAALTEIDEARRHLGLPPIGEALNWQTAPLESFEAPR